MGHIAGKETSYDILHTLEEHFHTTQKIWPPSANSITLTAGDAAAWTHGTKVEIITSLADWSDFHWVNISGMSANGEFEVILYQGGAGSEVEIGRCEAVRNAVTSQEGKAPMMTVMLPPATRISASLATSTGNADTCAVKLYGHEY
jgi:hypothetical protein